MSIFGNSVEIDPSGRLIKVTSYSDDEALENIRIYDCVGNQWIKRPRNLFDKFIMWIGRCGG